MYTEWPALMYTMLGRFLLGRFFYSDAVNTLIVVMWHWFHW